MIVLFAFSVHLIVLYYDDNELFLNKVEENYYSGITHPFIVILYFTVFTSLLVGFAIANLIGLHIWLRIHHLTTYEHICQKRAKNKAKQKLNSKKVKDSTEQLPTSNLSENISGIGSDNLLYSHLQGLKSSKPSYYNHDSIFSHDSNAQYSSQPEMSGSAYHSLDLARLKTLRTPSNLEATDEGLTRSPGLKELAEVSEHDITFDGSKV